MISLIWVVPILLLVLIFLWPPVIFIYLLIILYPISLIIIHKYGEFVPHWTFGGDPTHEINVYYRSQKDRACILKYRLDGSDVFITHDEDEIEITSSNTPKPIENPAGTELKHSEILGITHYFFLKNLQPDTRYYYDVVDSTSGEIVFENGIFKTQSVEKRDSFSFAVFGDMQIAENLEIIETYFTYLIRKNKPELIIALGDNWHKYKVQHDWKVFHTILRKIIPYLPYYNTPGNHDYGRDGGKSLALNSMNFPVNENNDWYYSFQYKKTMFISLSSRNLENRGFQEKQMQFLESKLNEADKLRQEGDLNWVIFYTHVPWYGPAYNSNRINDPNEEFIQQNWVPILEKHPVDLFFAGHKHSYCRDGNKIITASMHGVRDYKEHFGENYIVQNSHQYCKVDVTEEKINVYVKTWFNRNIEVLTITGKKVASTKSKKLK